MEYVLIVLIVGANSGPGGFSAEFNSLDACEAARAAYVEQLESLPYSRSYVRARVRRFLGGSICVPKGVSDE